MTRLLSTFRLSLAAFGLCLALSGGAHAGGQVGNGGDAVRCAHSPDNRFRGLYSLDYLQTIGAGGVDMGTVQVGSWPASRDRILGQLQAKAPALAASFEHFVAHLGNNRDWTRDRIWLPAPHGLVKIDDQEIIRSLPRNCGVSSTPGTAVDLIQTVIRIRKPGIIEYNVDLEVLVELMNAPLQFSYLLVHEWLWDHTDDVQASRWANQLLHSDQLEKLSADGLNKSLTNIGLSY